eukprot:GHVP01061554.1.p1 GENE.GHVP01061554.1~~GHVP01061554.1.p1  ORF type:complete len:128 (-),score=26.71 GHVP01061554.1:73-456(-)
MDFLKKVCDDVHATVLVPPKELCEIDDPMFNVLGSSRNENAGTKFIPRSENTLNSKGEYQPRLFRRIDFEGGTVKKPKIEKKTKAEGLDKHESDLEKEQTSQNFNEDTEASGVPAPPLRQPMYAHIL